MAAASDRERAACILAETTFCKDEVVAKRWGITTRTITNYRARAATDPELSSLFLAKKKELTEDWRDEAVGVLRSLLTKLGDLAQMATGPEHIRDVAGACKIVGELDIVRSAMPAKPVEVPAALVPAKAAPAPESSATPAADATREPAGTSGEQPEPTSAGGEAPAIQLVPLPRWRAAAG